jgi:hypothetical protein
MGEERPADDALNRFWNALVDSGDTANDAAANDLDPVDVATLRRLQAMRQSAPPKAARERVDAALQSYLATSHDGHAPLERGGPRRVASEANHPGDEGNASRRWWPAARSWLVGQAAAAALLLLTLGVGSLALRAAMDHASSPAIPAGSSMPTPLLRLTLPAFPFDPTVSVVALYRTRLAPGGMQRHQSQPGGADLFYVETGTITAQLVSGAQPPITLGSGLAGPTATSSAPNGDVSIAAGDAGWLPDGTTIELRNAGKTPATILWLVGNALIGNGRAVGEEDLGPIAIGTMPAAPVRVTLERRTLRPQETYAPPPPPALTAIGLVDPPFGYLAVAHDGTTRNQDATSRDVYILTLAPAAT